VSTANSLKLHTNDISVSARRRGFMPGRCWNFYRWYTFPSCAFRDLRPTQKASESWVKFRERIWAGASHPFIYFNHLSTRKWNQGSRTIIIFLIAHISLHSSCLWFFIKCLLSKNNSKKKQDWTHFPLFPISRPLFWCSIGFAHSFRWVSFLWTPAKLFSLKWNSEG